MWPSLLLAILSGALYVLSFPPFNQAYLLWFAFIPLFYGIEKLPTEKRNWKNIFLLGFITSFLIAAGGFYWIVFATENYGGLPFFAAVLLFLVFCITGQLQVPLYSVLREHFKMRSLFLLAALYAGIEGLYPKIFLDTAGNAFYDSPWIRQAADIGGPFFLTLLVVFVNELFFKALQLKKIKYAVGAAGTLVLILGYGYFRNTQFENLKTTHAGAPEFRVAMIQANIGDFLKVAAERGEVRAAEQVIGKYLELSKQAMGDLKKPDAIMWPETAYPAIFQRPLSSVELQMDRQLSSFTLDLKAYLIFGGYDSDITGTEYNSMFFYDPRIKNKDVYHKSVLLMFGETLPFAESFPSVKNWFPTMGFFGRGPGPVTMTVKNEAGHEFKLAPSICYEDLILDHSVNGAMLGADAIMNVTNDSWFGPDGEPYLHFALARFRSIETRLPFIRSTNTGITAWVDPSGQLLKSTEIFKADILQAEITNRIFPEPPYLVMARVFGATWFNRLTGLLTLLSIAFLIYQRSRQKKFS